MGYLEIPEFSWRPRLVRNREDTADDQALKHPDDRREQEAEDALGRLDGLSREDGAARASCPSL